MKKISIFKKIQMILLIVITVVSGIVLITNNQLQEYLIQHPEGRLIYGMAWGLLLFSFLFLFLDFQLLSSFKKDYTNLNQVAYSDHLSGIPNRFSCDVLIEKYADQDAPLHIGCVMIDLSSLFQVNNRHGHAQGNEQLKQFATLLTASAVSLCFVGRNGGNKFLAIFEDCTEEKVNIFLNRLKEKVEEHNQQKSVYVLEYQTGTALNEKEQLKNLTELIALANKRIYE